MGVLVKTFGMELKFPPRFNSSFFGLSMIEELLDFRSPLPAVSTEVESEGAPPKERIGLCGAVVVVFSCTFLSLGGFLRLSIPKCRAVSDFLLVVDDLSRPLERSMRCGCKWCSSRYMI